MGIVYKTINEAAELLDVSRTTVWRWIREGRLPAYRAGSRTIRIRAEDLEQRVQLIEPARQPPQVETQRLVSQQYV